MIWGRSATNKASTSAGSDSIGAFYYSTTTISSNYPSGFEPQILLVTPDSGNSGLNYVDLRAYGLYTVFYKTRTKDHSIGFYWLAIGY